MSEEEVLEAENRIKERVEEIAKGHNYQFIGRVGSFCPVVDGAGDGYLYRMQDGKAYAAPGSSGFRWLESEYVLSHGLTDKINRDFYLKLVDQAILDIDNVCKDSGFEGGYEWFVSDSLLDLSNFMNIPENAPEEIPFDE